jgi:hypothetical protein
MKTIDVPIDDETYSRAQGKALALSTSLPDVVANYLRQWTGGEERREEARRTMSQLFAQPDWQFGVGTRDTREERNGRR